jgi:chemotaxis protein MotB
MTSSRNSTTLRRLGLAALAAFLVTGCVPKKKFDAKSKENDACFRALTADNARKKELAKATSELQAKLAELSKALAENEGKTGETLSKLQKELMAKADEVQKLQTEKQELAKKTEELEKKSATYDSLVSSLQKEINEGKIKITEGNNRLSVELIDKVLFDSGSTVIKDEGSAALRKVAGVLRGINDKQILVEGHTDGVTIAGALAETFPTNWELSVARATKVVRFLEDAGVPPGNLGAAGFSKFRPVATNETDEGKRLNRRIEIVLTPRMVATK